nr:MAG TPA: hypothetical protein [Caudoviricetes sp.]
MKKAVAKWQAVVWGKVIVPFADLFRLECEYCWWWRGVFVGSTITAILFVVVSKLLEIL